VSYIKRALSPSNPVYDFFCLFFKFLRKNIRAWVVAERAGGGVVAGERVGAGADAAAAVVGVDATER